MANFNFVTVMVITLIVMTIVVSIMSILDPSFGAGVFPFCVVSFAALYIIDCQTIWCLIMAAVCLLVIFLSIIKGTINNIKTARYEKRSRERRKVIYSDL